MQTSKGSFDTMMSAAILQVMVHLDLDYDYDYDIRQ